MKAAVESGKVLGYGGKSLAFTPRSNTFFAQILSFSFDQVMFGMSNLLLVPTLGDPWQTLMEVETLWFLITLGESNEVKTRSSCTIDI